jgi:hypothetical protein
LALGCGKSVAATGIAGGDVHGVTQVFCRVGVTITTLRHTMTGTTMEAIFDNLLTRDHQVREVVSGPVVCASREANHSRR